MLDQQLSVVFYDLTTVRIHGEAEVTNDLRRYGMNKETGGIARQFVLGVVQSAEGLPLMHVVHPGNVAETKTLQSMLQKVLRRFDVQRVILVADRGLLSLDNVAEIISLWRASELRLRAPDRQPRGSASACLIHLARLNARRARSARRWARSFATALRRRPVGARQRPFGVREVAQAERSGPRRPAHSARVLAHGPRGAGHFGSGGRHP